MDTLIALLVAALGAVFYFKRQADKNAVDAKLGVLKGKDSELEKEQLTLADAIKEIDKNIEQSKETRQSLRKNLTLKEIRDNIKKNIQ